MSEKWCHFETLDEKEVNLYGYYSTREEAIEAGKMLYEGDFFVGKKVNVSVPYINETVIINEVIQVIYEEYDHLALELLFDATEDAKKDLSRMLSETFNKWMKKNGYKFGFESIENIVKIRNEK